MAEDIPVLDYFPGKIKGSGKYDKIKLSSSVVESPNYHAFEIVLVAQGKVAVYYGAVNSVVPDEVDPLLSNCTEFSVNDGDQLFINVDLDMDHFQRVDEVAISKTDYEDNQDDKFSILLGEISVQDGKVEIAQIVNKNVSTISCGIVHYYSVN